MGISGLLPLLKEITQVRHIKEFKGQTLAVDAYVWLHRGAYGCAEELATGKPTLKYVNYAMHRVRMLKYYGVTPYIVFDGGLLPSKMGTEGDREKRRTEALAKGNAFLAEGKSTLAREAFVKAVDVTPAMAYQLIKALRQEGIQYVVAPYEADPQLAYLEKRGIVDGIITEDSDLLVFGCRTVLFKLDGEGNCVSISRDDFSKCREYNFSDWSDHEFRQMAILSGCDYLESIAGLGLKTAYRLMRKYKTAEKVVQFVRLEGQLKVPRNYVDEFRRAELTFLHQRVFDPIERRLVHFSPLPEGKSADDMPFVGAELDPEYVCGLADGDIDPISKETMIDLMPNSDPTSKTNQASISSKSSYPPPRSKGGKTPAPQPATGASSILNFFARTPSTPASTSAVNPVKNVANQKRVQLLSSTSASGKENGGKSKVASPKRSSKFFGKTNGESVRVEKKEKVVEASVEVEVEEDYEAEVTMEDVEAVPSDDEDAEGALRDIEMSVSVVESRTEIEVEPEEENVVNAQTVDGSLAEAAIHDISLDATCASSPPHCISSPISTPPRKILHPNPAIVDSAAVSPSKIDLHSDAVVVSSPPVSDRADAGWGDVHVSSPAPVLPPLRLAGSSAPAIMTRVKEEVPPVVKNVVKPGPMIRATKPQQIEVMELSSDPIDYASSDAACGTERTPRPSTSTSRPPLSRTTRSNGNVQTKKAASKGKRTVEVRPDEAVETSNRGGKGKKRSSPVQVAEDEKEEVDPAVQSVAASWRAKFMMQNSSASKTPRPKINPRQRNSAPSVITTSRPPSLEKSSNPKLSSKPTSPRKASLSTASRIPLSPRSTNRISKPANLVRPTPPKLLPSQDADASSSPPPLTKRRKSTLPSSDGPDRDLCEGSSSPVIVTNPKLLAFLCKAPSSFSSSSPASS